MRSLVTLSPAAATTLRITITLATAFLPGPNASLLSQTRLATARATIQPTPPADIGAFGNFYSATFPENPSTPFSLFPTLPTYQIGQNTWLVDDTSVTFLPPSLAANPAAAARSFVAQNRLAMQRNLLQRMFSQANTSSEFDLPDWPPPTSPSPPQLLAPGSYPTNGTFWMLLETNWPPFPTYPCGPSNDVYLLNDLTYLVDDSGWSWPTPTNETGGGTRSSPWAKDQSLLWLESTGGNSAVAYVTVHGTVPGQSYTLLSRRNWTDPWDAEQVVIGAEGQNWTPTQVPSYGRRVLFFWAQVGIVTPQRIWLEARGISNGCLNAVLHGTSEGTYSILSTTDLPSTNDWSCWTVETNFLAATGEYWTAVSIPLAGRPKLFLAARSWLSSTGSGIPDWWLLQYLGHTDVDPYSLCPSNDGWTILQAYENGWNPNLFYTPPPPQNVNARLDSTGTNLTITWTSGGGPVTNYVIQQGQFSDTHGWSFSPAGQVAATTFSFSTSLTPFTPDFLLPNWAFRVRAYFANGAFADSQPSQLFSAALSSGMAVVRGPASELYLVVGSVPPDLSSVRVYWQLWDDAQQAEVFHSLDLAPASLVNGATRLPLEQMTGYTPFDWLDAQCIGTNGARGAVAELYPYPSPYGEGDWAGSPALNFVDCRPHLKQNLRFLLQSATIHQPFSYGPGGPDDCIGSPATVGVPETTFARPASSADYEYSGFRLFSSNLNYSFMQPFRPVQENFLWRNLAYAPADFDSSGNWKNGVASCTWDDSVFLGLRVLCSPQYQFTGTNSNSLPLALDLTSYPYLYARRVYNLGPPQYSNDLAEIGILVDGTSYSVPSGLHNVFGLPLDSVLVHPDGGGDFVLNAGDTSVPAAAYYISEDYFCHFGLPALQTVDYYFASQTPCFNYLWDPFTDTGPAPTLPGSPTFSVANTSPLLITGLGQPITVSGWAKQAITNGYAGKYAYLEQYFDKAYTIDANGNTTTNEAGLLSPYGEFFPMQPGPAALVTMPDIETGQRGTGVVSVIKLQLDVNHDGQIDLSFSGPDNTSQARPFVFWINNDADVFASTGGEDRNYPDSLADYRELFIGSSRDLEDFARLWVCGVPALTNAGYQATLSWDSVSSGAPVVKLFRCAETNGGIGYLTNMAIATLQTARGTIGEAPSCAIGVVSPSHPLTLSASLFTNAVNKYFLFEGCTNGTGRLVLTISQNGQIIAQTGAWLDLHDVKDFYERAIITNIITGTISSNWSSTIQTVQYPTSSDLGDDTNIIVLVHGFFVGDWDWLSSSETVFKRLYWAGFQGRFATVKWPCKTGDPLLFDLSELAAYKASAGLTAYLNQLRSRLPANRLNILAHSQGNPIVSEAIEDHGAPFDTYILSQGAIPASCYDVNAPTDATLLSKEVPPRRTPDWQPMGYHGVFTNLTGRVVNYFNTNDFLLATGKKFGAPANWEFNQGLKPDDDFGSDGTNVWEYVTGVPNMPITDPEMSRAFVARSRTKAVGALSGLGGVVSASVDLHAQFGFDKAFGDHSAQWTWPIQTSRPYYLQVLDSIKP
jgi:hypothetical protein